MTSIGFSERDFSFYSNEHATLIPNGSFSHMTSESRTEHVIVCGDVGDGLDRAASEPQPAQQIDRGVTCFELALRDHRSVG